MEIRGDMTTATTILQPGQIEAGATAIPELRLPPSDLFITRARRLRQLAEGHALGDYLRFIATLVEAQQTALMNLPPTPLADETLLARCHTHYMPPYTAAGWRRDPVWIQVARNLAATLGAVANATARDALARVRDGNDAWLEDQASRILSWRKEGLDVACAPVIGAALQVYWTHLAASLAPAQVARPEHPSLCPVCGSHPVASVVRIGGGESGLRYLQCALCSSEWHVVRTQCSNCGNSKDIAYYNVEGDSGSVRAEVCPECETYLKVAYMDTDPHAEAMADDLASLALDMLMGEQGYGRSGINLLMVHGDAPEN
jgi:FdhE protein